MSDKPMIRVVSAEVQREGRYLLVQRPEKATMPLLWEFPGGRVREGETDAAALARALRARLGVEVEVGEELLTTTHPYAAYNLTMAVYRCVLLGDPACLDVADLAWVEPARFAHYPFPGADQATVDALLGEN